MSDLDEILAGIDFELRPLVVGGTKYGDEAVVTGKEQAKQAIEKLIEESYKKGYIDGGIAEMTR